MFTLFKFHFSAQHIRNVYKSLFSELTLGKDYRIPRKFRGNNNYISTQTVGKSNNLRSMTTKTVLKPTEITFPTENKKNFIKFLPNIISDLIENYTDIPEATKIFSDFMEYNLAKGSYIAGLSTLTAYEMLEKPENLAKNLKISIVLAWCAEFLIMSSVLVDDVVNNSETRCKAVGWFGIEGSGLHDILLLENCTYIILKKYLSSHPMYRPIMDLFYDVNIKRTYGLVINRQKPILLEQMTLDRYTRIVKYKTGYFVSMPTILAMYLTGTHSAELQQNIQPILFQIGQQLQVEDDMWNCFGDTNFTGKIGADIQNGKCTWPALVAVQKANPLQRKVMEDHYGRPEKESVETIRTLYEELDIPAEYVDYKAKSFEQINNQIQDVMNDALRAWLFTQAQILCNRRYE